jgi:hypothetical protein
MTIEIPTQPIPAHIAEACAWLSAAERYTGPDQTLAQRLDAGDAINILCDVRPPYPPIDMTRPAAPLARVAAAAERALEQAMQTASSVEEKLRVARALGSLRQGSM